MSERYQLQRSAYGHDLDCWDVVDTQAHPARTIAGRVVGHDAKDIAAAMNIFKKSQQQGRKELEPASV